MSDTQETQASNESTRAPSGDGVQNTTESVSSVADEVAPPVAALIGSIRSAVVRNASQEARAAGVAACRSILTVLEAKPGQPLTIAPPPTALPASPLASLLSQPGTLSKLAAMSREQLLELVKQVTGAVSPRTQTPAAAAPRFHLIQIPQVRRPGDG